MFVRKLKNRSGSQSIQVIQKLNGRYKIIKTLGSATTQQEIEMLCGQTKLFSSQSMKPLSKLFLYWKMQTSGSLDLK
jgi:hypothetical protein